VPTKRSAIPFACGARIGVLMTLMSIVVKTASKLAQLVGGEQEEQHHRVGLLGHLLAVGIVAGGLEDPVEALDVGVLGAVAGPAMASAVSAALRPGPRATRLRSRCRRRPVAG
jgi:hypothetical protein